MSPRHRGKTNAMRSGLYPLVADAIVGHGDRKKDVRSVYLTISDADLVREIDKLTFDHGKTEIWWAEMIDLLETQALTTLQMIHPVARMPGLMGYSDNDDPCVFLKIKN